MNKRFIIADSGSTKTHWALIDNGSLTKEILTGGINPYFLSPEEIAAEVATGLLPHLGDFTPDTLWFYGAGCAFPDKIALVQQAIALSIPQAEVIVESDLVGAARGLCGREAGIAAILGTGSNSCYYDGTQIVQNISPLGFILGDEGSGAHLGKLLAGDCLKNQLSPGIREQFLERFRLTPADIIDRVYRQPFPNRFLAGLSRFIAENSTLPELRRIVLQAFTAFFTRNIYQYDYRNHPVHCTGSIAWHYRELLQEAACQTGVQLGKIEQNPMQGLITYHLNP
ncbi:MAG: ATPase [Bacteroides sp.]|nr:ATPase [Bacteroides sp.]